MKKVFSFLNTNVTSIINKKYLINTPANSG